MKFPMIFYLRLFYDLKYDFVVPVHVVVVVLVVIRKFTLSYTVTINTLILLYFLVHVLFNSIQFDTIQFKFSSPCCFSLKIQKKKLFNSIPISISIQQPSDSIILLYTTRFENDSQTFRVRFEDQIMADETLFDLFFPE